MTSAYDGWPRPAREMAQAVDSAVRAAQASDAEGFAVATVDLRRADREQLATLLGTATQELLERALPDGLDAEGAERVIDGCLRSARPWYAALDENLLVRALTGALGMADPDDVPAVDPDDVLAHGLLLIAELIGSTSTTIDDVLGSAMRELVRAQTVELP